VRRAPLHNRSRAAAFLCWHSIAAAGPPFVSVAPELFEQQLQVLAAQGLRSGLHAELDLLASGARPPTPLAFLTFDDGFADTAVTAAPLLEAAGQRALVFVLPSLMDEGAAFSWPRVAQDQRDHPAIMRSLTWPMAERMAERGHEFGSHTLTHPDLRELGPEALREELLDSRRTIERRLGSCRSLAYPFGHWSEEVASAAADAGYSYGFTLPYRSQLRATPLTIPRIAVDHRDGPDRFGRKLSAPRRALLLSPVKTLARRLSGRRPRHERTLPTARR
jgi:peptidoglycan/xylan/chitin deacetylase (PgdA/CDA1 family)